ncbi:hypothetical protein OG413_38705 [Streptomyces sp. NBC_01433]|uniref:hypothetical protein n=1 Tax=Streptomyces sp. NBC_01433 TaxID=2903864 RepID=UPI00224D5D2C|nr:hypothetical protein [Streptomyces sp. NBC_01433]MCX4681138.1 hypothetical protein [Streptomyces sp. NBC_01433]
MREERCLLLRGLLPREQVAAVRDSVLQVCTREGRLRNCDAPQDVVRPEAACESPDPRYYAAYRRVVSLEE